LLLKKRKQCQKIVPCVLPFKCFFPYPELSYFSGNSTKMFISKLEKFRKKSALILFLWDCIYYVLFHSFKSILTFQTLSIDGEMIEFLLAEKYHSFFKVPFLSYLLVGLLSFSKHSLNALFIFIDKILGGMNFKL
jgi:hypothetical protein